MTPAEKDILAVFVREYPQEVLRALAPLLLERWTPTRHQHREIKQQSVPLSLNGHRRPGRPPGRPLVLTPVVRKRIVKLRQSENLSAVKIADQLHLARSTVANFLATEKQNGTIT